LEPVDLLVTGEYLVRDPFSPALRNGAVTARDGVIVETGTAETLKRRYLPVVTLDRPAGLIIPGLINMHTHAPMILFRGLADDLPLKTWLEEHIFPAESRLTPELVSLGTELACAEMIRCGTTGFVDMYLFEDQVAGAVDRVGMRGWLGEGVFDFPTPAFPGGMEALRETERLMDKWRDHPRISITVDPHTPYTCSRELLEESCRIAAAKDALIVMHVSETDWEEAEIRKIHGASPAHYLDTIGILSSRFLAVHCVTLNNRDISLFAEKKVNVVHCPESNLKLGSGIAPVAEFLENGLSVGIGTDGAASNNDLDLMSEMDTCAKLAKGVGKDPTLVSAPEALAMTTSMAAEILHREDLGRLVPGAAADLAILDLHQVHMRPCYKPVSHIVYCARSGDVQDVVVHGRILMKDRVLTTIDEESLLEKLERAVDEIRM